MREELLTWAATTIGRILEVHPLHDEQGPWRLLTPDRSAVLRAPTPRVDAAMIATGATALQLAERYHLPAPRLLNTDLSGADAGVPASLETDVPGSTTWPAATPETLRSAADALARLHSIPMDPQEHLPYRPRPIAVDDFATDRRTGRIPTTPLLQEADALVRAHGQPTEPTVLVHGDVWPGNLLWNGGRVAAFIDWKTAGVGAPGVDLSELRKQIAITFAPQALTNWHHDFPNRAYWDAVAALNTPTTLYSQQATTRRDVFLHQAVQRLR